MSAGGQLQQQQQPGPRAPGEAQQHRRPGPPPPPGGGGAARPVALAQTSQLVASTLAGGTITQHNRLSGFID